MDAFFDFFRELLNPESIIKYGGIYLLLFVVFAETGLFAGFFLPGDSLLFTAGLLCSTGYLAINPVLLIILFIVAAVTGNMTGYAFGKKVGILLFKRKSGFLFRQEHLVTAQEFYQNYGKKTLILSRFFPIVRTFAPIVAGIAKVDYMKFFIYSLTGAFLWVGSLVLAGYFLGKSIPDLSDYLGYIVTALIVVTSIPFIIRVIKSRLVKSRLKVYHDKT